MTQKGHAVSQFAVSFYAEDSEQAGLLARAQEIENLDRGTRAQALLADEARTRWCGRGGLHRAAQRLARPGARPARPRPGPPAAGAVLR
jgi:chromosome segregation protein